MNTKDASNQSLPADFEKEAKRRYEELATREAAFEAFLEHEKNEFQRLRTLDANKTLLYKPAIGTITPCGNGDLDRQLDHPQQLVRRLDDRDRRVAAERVVAWIG